MVEFDHLKENGMSYFDHWKQSMFISIRMLLAGVLGTVHAFYPDIFTISASSIIYQLHREFEIRKQQHIHKSY